MRDDSHLAAVVADDPQRHRLVDPQAAPGGREVHVDREDALHAVEAETLPHLHAEQVRQRSGLTHEGLAGRGIRESGPGGLGRGRADGGAGPGLSGRGGLIRGLIWGRSAVHGGSCSTRSGRNGNCDRHDVRCPSSPASMARSAWWSPLGVLRGHWLHRPDGFLSLDWLLWPDWRLWLPLPALAPARG